MALASPAKISTCFSRRYYKGSRDGDSVSSGTGLGLAIKGILEL